jgi:hypothetical protein
MTERITSVATDLQRCAEDARASFGHLSPAQLDWKPGPESWSLAQCLDHLIVTHSKYFPLFDRLAAGNARPSLLERVSPLSGYFGRFLIRSMDPANLKKMKTAAKADPSSSDMGANIVERFITHQHELIGHLQKLPAGIDPLRTIVTSPLLGIVTYSLDDTFTILVFHCLRLLIQARRVMEGADFPAH